MRNIFLLLASIAICSATQAQVVCYTYDAAGNRTAKAIGPCNSSIVSAGEQSIVAGAESINLEPAKTPVPTPAPPQSTAMGKVYPNPNNGFFELQLDEAPEAGAWYELYDGRGVLIGRQQADGTSAVFDLSGKAAGEYLLFLRQANGALGRWLVIRQ